MSFKEQFTQKKMVVIAGAGILVGVGVYYYWTTRENVEDPVSPSLLESKKSPVEQRQKKILIFTLGRYWDLDDFKCQRCDAEIKKKRLEFRTSKTVPNMPICLDCYMEENHPKCEACKKTLYERCIKALGAQYHKSCLLCDRCHCPFADCEYYILNGKAYDVDCYHLKKYETVITSK